MKAIAKNVSYEFVSRNCGSIHRKTILWLEKAEQKD